MIFLYAAISGCLTVAAWYLIVAHLPDHPLGPPRWTRYMDWVADLAYLATLTCVAATLVLLPFRYRSLPHLIFTTIAALTCLCVAPLRIMTWSELQDRSRHLPFVRLAADAHMLVQCANVYSADHADLYPPHLTVLLLQGDIRPKALAGFDLTPYVLPSPPPSINDWATIAAAVDAQSVFVYTGADLRYLSDETMDKIIVVYTKPTRVLPGHRILAFADNHAELVTDADLPRYFAASNAARSKRGLPPFVMDGPVPSPPLGK
jgi:hypothetical protein